MEHLTTLGKIPFIIIIIIIIMYLCLPCKLKDCFRTPTKQEKTTLVKHQKTFVYNNVGEQRVKCIIYILVTLGLCT
jgi:hypothetical protein